MMHNIASSNGEREVNRRVANFSHIDGSYIPAIKMHNVDHKRLLPNEIRYLRTLLWLYFRVIIPLCIFMVLEIMLHN